MRFLPNVSIKRKQTLIIMTTSSVALLLACVAFVAYELHTFQEDMRRNLFSLAAHIADKTTAVITFEEKSKARETLNSLLLPEPNVVLACLYKSDGRTLASYRRPDQIGYFNFPPMPQKAGFHFGYRRLSLAQPIMLEGEQIGMIYIESDLDTMYSRLFRYAGIVGVVLLVSSVVAFALSSRLQRVISEPIIHLAGVAKIVSQKKNYAVRAVRFTEPHEESDELNSLIDGFNEMLGQIQARDAELQKARDELEKRVEERTRDLLTEITERVRAEKEIKQQFARISLLNQITQSIAERMDLQSVLNIVLKQLEDHLPADLGAVFVMNSTGDFKLTALRSIRKLPPEAAFRLTVGSAMSLAHAGLQDCMQRQTVWVPNASKTAAPLMHLLSRAELLSVVGVPMMVEEKLFGVLLVARQNAESFSEGECEFLRMLSEQVALAAHQARLHSELQSAYNELRQTQQAVMQQQRLQALGQMASGIAHDINNALSPIIVYSELIMRNERTLGEGSRRHLNNIKTAGEDIAHIVARMREFYRRREENEQVTSINLNRLCEQVAELTRPRWRDIPQQKGVVVEMRSDFEAELPEIYGNASELREALTNLILNSVDAMPAGGTLTIRTRVGLTAADSKSRTHVVLEVCDSGIGMDDETKRRCLEPFFSTKGQRGTGLGLAMVYGIMERHEGGIEIESAPGKGTTMRLIFPVRDLEVLDDTALLPGVEMLPPRKILCIDDEPLLRQLIKELLEGEGHFVTVADGGQSGIDAFRAAQGNGAFDVVITDLGMPYVDGRQVACVLKKESPKTPIILLTGWGSMMKADGEVPAQIDAVISKPPRMSELREALVKLTGSTAAN